MYYSRLSGNMLEAGSRKIECAARVLIRYGLGAQEKRGFLVLAEAAHPWAGSYLPALDGGRIRQDS